MSDKDTPNPRPEPELKPEDCDYCKREKADSNSFYPPHYASRNCRSGGRYHCTCDTCF